VCSLSDGLQKRPARALMRCISHLSPAPAALCGLNRFFNQQERQMNIALIGIDHLCNVLEHLPELAGMSHFRVTMSDQSVHQVTRAGLLELAQTGEAPRITFSPVEAM